MNSRRELPTRPPELPNQSDLFAQDEPAPVIGRPLPDERIVLLRFVMAGILGLLLFQGLRLQVTNGFFFRKEAEGNRVREFVEYAPRGIFLDRFGSPLVQNVPSIELVADLSQLPDDLEQIVSTLREALPTRDLTPVLAQLQAFSAPERQRQSETSRGSAITVLRVIAHKEFLALAARADRLPGLRLETSSVRTYAGSGAFAHVLGYTGKISPEDRADFRDYLLTESVGKSGLERMYEALLRGRHGARRSEVDAFGAIQHDLGREPPTPGANLRTNLDAGLQERAARSLAAGLRVAGVRRGAVVALDPFSGAVRALVSAPTFPQDSFAAGLSPDAARRVLENPDSPLLNRAVQGEYVPGSTFKLAVAAGALEEHVATPTTTVVSRGGIRVNQWFFPDWKPGGHGRTDLRKAISESVNTYFYTIGGGVDHTPGLGIERLTAWARRVGFGAPTGIDLPDERAGFLPSPSWKEQQKGEAWYIGDTYHAAIGQGDVLITPLQLAVVTATIANGGTVVAPRLLDAIEDDRGKVTERRPPVVRAERAISAETASAVRTGMRAAVTEGSARGLAELPVPAAAKTGTAQVGGTERTHAWVTVFAPFERPKLVLVVLLEQAGGGDRYAVPVARDILQWYFSTDRQHPSS